MSKKFEEFMRDVPRGDSNRYLKQQKAPQARWMKLKSITESPLLSYDPHNPGKKILVLPRSSGLSVKRGLVIVL